MFRGLSLNTRLPSAIDSRRHPGVGGLFDNVVVKDDAKGSEYVSD